MDLGGGGCAGNPRRSATMSSRAAWLENRMNPRACANERSMSEFDSDWQIGRNKCELRV